MRAAHAREDWAYLWHAALPIAAAALRRRVREGRLGAFDEDMAQDVFLALETSVQAWSPERGAFTTFVNRSVGWLVPGFQWKHRNAGLTGVPIGEAPVLVSLDQPLRPEDPDSPATLHEAVAYPAAPRGLGDPAAVLEQRQAGERLRAALAGLTADQRHLLWRVYGTGVTHARALRVPRQTVTKRIATAVSRVRKALA